MTDEQIDVWNECNDIYWRLQKNIRRDRRWALFSRSVAAFFLLLALWAIVNLEWANTAAWIFNASIWEFWIARKWSQAAKNGQDVAAGLDNMRDELLLPVWKKQLKKQ
jgi:hypothetical protein